MRRCCVLLADCIMVRAKTFVTDNRNIIALNRRIPLHPVCLPFCGLWKWSSAHLWIFVVLDRYLKLSQYLVVVSWKYRSFHLLGSILIRGRGTLEEDLSGACLQGIEASYDY